MPDHMRMCKPRKITIVDLRNSIEDANKNLAQSGSNYRYVLGGVCGSHQVLLYWKDSQGRDHCETTVEIGSSRECIAAIHRHTHSVYGRKREDLKSCQTVQP